MKKLKYFLLLLFLVFSVKLFSQDFQIPNIKLEYINNQLIVTYSIKSRNPADKFSIRIEIKNQSGQPINAYTITGDIGDNIKPGDVRKITWDIAKDSILLNEDITVKLIGEKSIESYSKGSLVLRSLVFPGWGQTKMTGQPWWLGGVAAYGALAGGIIYYNKCVNTADTYNDPLTPSDDKPDLKDKFDNEFMISRILSITAASIWVANVIWVAVAPNPQQQRKHAMLYIEPVTTPHHQGAMLSLRVNF